MDISGIESFEPSTTVSGGKQSRNMQTYRSVEKLDAISTPTAGGHTMKDQEIFIQELKKENFDLKLRLYMEQKERERVTEEFKAKIVVLEADLGEALNELDDALEREKEYEVCLNDSKKREKALLGKQRRLEETAREQENEINYLTLTRHSNQKVGGSNKVVATNEVSSQTDFPFYQERSVDVNFDNVDLKDSPGVQTAMFSGEAGAANGPEGVDLLNNGTLMRKKNEILREAKRRRTAKKKRDKDGKGYGPAEAARPGKLSFFNKLCCCLPTQQSAEYDVEDVDRRM